MCEKFALFLLHDFFFKLIKLFVDTSDLADSFMSCLVEKLILEESAIDPTKSYTKIPIMQSTYAIFAGQSVREQEPQF